MGGARWVIENWNCFGKCLPGQRPTSHDGHIRNPTHAPHEGETPLDRNRQTPEKFQRKDQKLAVISKLSLCGFPGRQSEKRYSKPFRRLRS